MRSEVRLILLKHAIKNLLGSTFADFSTKGGKRMVVLIDFPLVLFSPANSHRMKMVKSVLQFVSKDNLWHPRTSRMLKYLSPAFLEELSSFFLQQERIHSFGLGIIPQVLPGFWHQ